MSDEPLVMPLPADPCIRISSQAGKVEAIAEPRSDLLVSKGVQGLDITTDETVP